MGERIRGHDWSATPLGPPETWPDALRSALSIALHSTFPTAVYWGPDLHLLYGDAWAPIPADKHPWALGRPARDVWSDIWNVIEPQFRQVLDTGQGFSAYNQMLPMVRHGQVQETYWTYSFTPIVDENGNTAGVLNQGHETTVQILTERALRESEERLQLALATSNSVGTWDWNVPEDRVVADQGFARLYGVDPNKAVAGAPITEFFGGIHPDDKGRVEEAVAETLRTGSFFSEEYRVLQPDGSVRWLLCRGRCTLAEDGAPLRFPGIALDITERKEIEEALRRARERQDFIFNLFEELRGASSSAEIRRIAARSLATRLGANRAGFYMLLDDNRIAFQEGWGDGVLAPQQGEVAADEFGPDFYRRISAGNTIVYADACEEAVFIDTRVPRSGTRAGLGVPLLRHGRWVAGLYVNHSESRNWSDEDVALAEEVAEITWDAVARADAAGALRESEEKFRAIANSIDQMIWSTLPNGYHDYFNDRWYEYTGVSYGSTYGDDWNGVFHPDDQEASWELWSRSLETGEPYHIEYRLRHHSGEYRWVLGRAQPVRAADGSIIRWYGTCTDIHEQKIAQDRQAFLLGLNDLLRPEADPAAATLAAARALGEHLHAARAGYGDIVEGGEVVRVGRDWTRDSDIPSIAGESRILDGFGPAVIAELRAGRTLVVDDCYADPRAGVAFAATWDSIGCRALVVVPLVRNGELRAILYLHEPQPRAWTAEEVALADDVAQRTWDAVERARAESELRTLNATLEERVAERTAELERTQEALRQSQKMEAIGQLTGGIAHDFNNMLAVVIGGLNLLQRRLERGETDVAKYIDAAMDGATRAASLTQRLLAFSRQQPLSPESINANRMIDGMIELLTRTLGENIRVDTALVPSLWKAHADPSQLENLVLNLAVNARDAMPAGGKLTIETANVDIGRDQAREYEVKSGQYVLIAVSDTGSGMTPEVMAKAFDPFFTTKSVGKGTGLGLSQVFGFVRQSGGHVKIYSEVGIGTTVKVYLPRFYGDETPVQQKVAEAPRGGRPDEIILVVEDEERVRNYSTEALRDLGYTVIHASNGPDALRLIEAGQDVTLLFTDVVMPEMTGRTLADHALKLLPGLKVLFTTGYTRNAVVHNGVLDPGTNFLPKPFAIDQLAAKVRSVLDE
jgi:PAS domain S-box-containing protein